MPESLPGDPYYNTLKNLVVRETGLSYYLDKDNLFAERLGRRLNHLRIPNCSRYADLLTSAAQENQEWAALIEELTIGESYFYRYPDQLNALRDVILSDFRKRKRQQRQLRIWCAGCSTGAEPYSIAILLQRELARWFSGWHVSILGTDINQGYLNQACKGFFSDWDLRSIPQDIKRDCFIKAEKSWQIKPEYKALVTFEQHNLAKDPFPSLLRNLANFDVIVCCNVLIYFDHGLIRKLLEQFQQCLGPGGWFLTGHSEPYTEISKVFAPVFVTGTTLFLKSGNEAGEAADAPVNHGLEHNPPELAELCWPPASIVHAPTTQADDGKPAADRPLAGTALDDHTASVADITPGESVGIDEIRRLTDVGEWEQAARRCEALLAKQPFEPDFYLYFALIQEQRGWRKDSEQALRRAIYLDRNFILGHYHLGRLQLENEDGEAAARSFSNAAKLLSRLDKNETLDDADGLTVSALQDLIHLHMAILRKP